jgi:hypothetical protein
MTFDWQNAIVLLIVAGASGYLARRAWQAIAQRRAGCGACSTCPAGEAPADKNEGPAVVTLEPFPPRARD